MKGHLRSNVKCVLFASLLVIAGALMAGCGIGSPKTYTIGVVIYNPTLTQVIDGFKAQMTTLGYVEGKNVTYVYKGVLDPDAATIEAEVQRLIDQKVDLLFTLGNSSALAAKKITAGKNIPVVFAPVLDPVGNGLVASAEKPGGDLTGVQEYVETPQALAWLLKAAPGTKKVYAPYNPVDVAAVTAIKPLPDAAAKAGIDFTAAKVSTVDKVVADIKALPKNAAVLFVPSASLEPGRNVIRRAVIERGLPSVEYAVLQSDALIAYGMQRLDEGSQAAGLADKIFKGAKPGDLSLETAKQVLVVNMKTAKTMGFTFPDGIASQAVSVIQ